MWLKSLYVKVSKRSPIASENINAIAYHYIVYFNEKHVTSLCFCIDTHILQFSLLYSHGS